MWVMLSYESMNAMFFTRTNDRSFHSETSHRRIDLVRQQFVAACVAPESWLTAGAFGKVLKSN